MKNYLAVFLGKPEAMDAWKALPEAERRDRENAASRLGTNGSRTTKVR